MTIAQNPHALAIVAALEAASLAVGDGVAPRTGTPPNERVVAPCVVLYMVPGGEVDGSAGDPDEWADARFQLTSVGRVASEARHYADLAKAAVCSPGAITVAGRSVQRVRQMSPWGPVDRDDNALGSPLFYVPAVFGVWTFPA